MNFNLRYQSKPLFLKRTRLLLQNEKDFNNYLNILEKPLDAIRCKARRLKEKMLDNLERKIEEVDILTDFDKTLINENSYVFQYSQYLFYLLSNFKLGKSIKFFLGGIKLNREFKKNGDIPALYYAFENCPVIILNNVIRKLSLNEEYLDLLEKFNIEKAGVVSRNNYDIIFNYLNSLKNFNLRIDLIAANVLEVRNGFYTGRVKINVNNENLINFVRKKEYLCGEDEKRILEKYNDVGFEKFSSLYICYKKSFPGFNLEKSREVLIGNQSK